MLRLVCFAFAALVGVVVWFTVIAALVLLLLGIGVFVVPAATTFARGFLNSVRRQFGIVGVQVAVPYTQRRTGRRGVRRWWDRNTAVLSDPATWRDLVWLPLNGVLGVVLCLVPLVVVVAGVAALAAPVALPQLATSHPVLETGVPFSTAWVSVPAGLVLIGLGLWSSPRLLHGYATASKLLLAPTRRRALEGRVRELADRRASVLDSQSSELHRIERDLHDGAQARLVALGLQLAAAERELDDDPVAARDHIAQARQLSRNASSQLRDLVRGIHPPVLADRGLGEALRALALESPLRVDVSIALPERLRPPLEAAAYFAVSEVLTNAAKHGQAERVSLDAWQDGPMLRLRVVDDGRGGADVRLGTGLRGITRRLAAFDGAIEVQSPPGGPTRVLMEVPCDSYSPKISSS